jgi:deoxyribodipyrimidine photolyase-related protein
MPPTKTPPAVAVWLLEDQLSPTISSLAASTTAPVLMVESLRHFRRWNFHKKRLVFQTASMRHFAAELQKLGRQVHYFSLTDKPYRDAVAAVRQFVKHTGIRQFIVASPSEHHTKNWLSSLQPLLGIEIQFVNNNLFLLDLEEFADWAKSVKSPVMEFFYRRMRAKHNVLMDGKKPIGGEWNLDKENRKRAPAGLLVPQRKTFKPDDITRAAMRDINQSLPAHPGRVEGFDLPVTRADAQEHLRDFIKHRLPQFGDYEDAMVTGQPLMFHSLISPLINAGLLLPMECIEAAVNEYHAGRAPLNSVEGFVRQILGWREYVYGIYHTFMPEYRQRNSRKDTRELPAFFWTADTQMNCLKQSLGSVVEDGYSHHIQRLMVICNYATLTGLSPQAVNDWFYAMYLDSHDWVVTPNVIGMGMAADGGTMATKPYVSSGAYIDRMSDYCKACHYDVKKRTGDDACPFNYLFWTFLDATRQHYKANPRMTMMLKNLGRIDAGELKEMKRLRLKVLG